MRLAAVLALGVLTVLPGRAEGPPTGRPSGVLGERDRREPKEPDGWPWSSIGQVNVVLGRSQRIACTGVLVAPDRALTAGHCLYDQAGRRWANPAQIHFVAGVARGASRGHSKAMAIVRDPAFDPTFTGYGALPPGMLARDWAVLELDRPIDLRPVPARAIAPEDFAAALDGGETARAGYGADRRYLLSFQRGCVVGPVTAWPGLLAHDCDSAGADSGSPILLVKGDEASVIGLLTAVSSTFEPGVGHRAQFGLGVAATAFIDALQSR